MKIRLKFCFIKDLLSFLSIFLTGCAGIVFIVLYLETFSNGIFVEYYILFLISSESIVTILTIIAFSFYTANKKTVYKIIFFSIVIIDFVLLILYLLKISGFLNKIKTVEGLRLYVASFKSYAVLIFVFLQFAQVVFLPIPSFITVGAGVLLFGAFKAALYSSIGIILGSIVAFYIGRIFGYKVTKWLVGEENLKKCFNFIKGKDKIVFTFMFLFPFFPDDVLCFVAGITSMSSKFFINMMIIARIISTFAASFSINNSIIPYNTWWGIVLWGLFFLTTIFLSIFIYKKGDKLENIFNRKKSVK